jgi:hypothetical protein
MSRAQNLLHSMKENVLRIDSTLEHLETLKRKKIFTEEDIQMMEALHRKEFSLYMDNSSIFDDLMEELENEEDFTRKRYSDEAYKLLRVEIIDL